MDENSELRRLKVRRLFRVLILFRTIRTMSLYILWHAQLERSPTHHHLQSTTVHAVRRAMSVSTRDVRHM